MPLGRLFIRLAALGALVLTFGCAHREVARQDELEGGGIRVERVSVTAAGMMLDLRYRITDLDEARKVLNRSNEMLLVDQKSGIRLPVPNTAKVGKLRQLPQKDSAAKVHWAFFNNPGMLVRPGDLVTLSVGEVTIRDIMVVQ